jgi:hypothetical protein
MKHSCKPTPRYFKNMFDELHALGFFEELVNINGIC